MTDAQKKGVILVPFMSGKGGTERVVQNLFVAMQAASPRTLQMSVLSIGGSDDYEWAKNLPIQIVKVGKSRKARTLAYMTVLPFIIFSYVRKHELDFVVSTNPIMWYLTKVSCRLLRKRTKVIAWYHYSLEQKPVKKLFLKNADHYLAISSGIVQQLIKNGISEKNISLIYNPVQTSERIVERPDSVITFVYIGRIMLDGQKNLRELLKALEHVSGNWKLELYGDLQQAEPVKKFAQSLKISNRLVWHGFVADPWSEITEATSLLLTSKYEGLPMVLCEGIMHGLYLVSADIDTGPADIIEPENGVLYESGNVDELGRILQRIVDGQVLPDSTVIKRTAKKFEIETYRQNFYDAVERSFKK